MRKQDCIDDLNIWFTSGPSTIVFALLLLFCNEGYVWHNKQIYQLLRCKQWVYRGVNYIVFECPITNNCNVPLSIVDVNFYAKINGVFPFLACTNICLMIWISSNGHIIVFTI